MEPRPRVLIVEDDPGLRTLLRVALGAEFELDETDNGEEALRLITDRRYDAVLLDVVLAAGQSGYTVCHAMRQMPRGRDVKIIFCTAMGGVPGRSRDQAVQPAGPPRAAQRAAERDARVGDELR
jgi:CheY-like chemotaxis protein